jgi:hypothetical protein
MLELDRGKPRDLRDQPHVILGNLALVEEIVDVEDADHGVADHQRRAENRADALHDDRLRAAQFLVHADVHERQRFFLLDHFEEDGVADAQFRGVGAVLTPHFDVDERLAVRGEKSEGGARCLRVFEHPVDDESEQLLGGTIFDQFAREKVQGLELGEIAAGVGPLRFLDLLHGDGDGHARRGIRDGEHAVGVVLGGLENDLGIAEADAVAGAEGMIALDAVAVQVRAVGAAAVLQNPRSVIGHDLGVFARKVAILDGDGAVGSTPDGNGDALQLLPEGREQRRVNRYLSARGDGFHIDTLTKREFNPRSSSSCA